MSVEGADYGEVLAEAQAVREADPTADVEGYDAGAKAAIIASIVFGVQVSSADVHHEGISVSLRPTSRMRADSATSSRPLR